MRYLFNNSDLEVGEWSFLLIHIRNLHADKILHVTSSIFFALIRMLLSCLQVRYNIPRALADASQSHF